MTSPKAGPVLARLLIDLAEELGAVCAAVIDEGNGLWCISHPGFDSAADRFYREEIATKPDVHLNRGSGLHIVRKPERWHGYVAESFASIYVVIVWFENDFDPFTARMKLKAALPKIEAHTLAMPGPGNTRA